MTNDERRTTKVWPSSFVLRPSSGTTRKNFPPMSTDVSAPVPQPETEGLTVRAARGMIWSSLSLLTRQVTQLLVTIILMRLLEPGAFGLVEIAGIFNSIIFIVTDLG